MANMKTLIFLLSAIVLLAVMDSPVFSQEVLDRIVAVVDDAVILDSEVTQVAWLMSSQMGIDPARDPQRFMEMRKMALRNLVNKELLVIQADNDTIKADERQVDSYLEQQMQQAVQQAGGENKLEEALGMPLSQIRRNYRTDIEKELRANTVQEKRLMNVKVTRREVRKFFENKKDSLGRINDTMDISHILVETRPGEKARLVAMEKAIQIRKKIVDGADFAELAATYSDDAASAKRGGDLGFMSRSEFVREYAEAALKLQPGEVSDIVETQFGFHIIKLEEKRGEKLHTRHILIAIKPDKDDEIAAAEKIKKIFQELKDGADFDEMVLQYSDDASTKADHGHLGSYEVEQLKKMAKEFVYALQNVQVGQICEPVKTQYGFHILRLNAREKARDYDLDKDYDRLEQMALNYKKQVELQKWLIEIQKQVFVDFKDKSMI
jgi:peptidyl-prolyl cis-trans isomerase SurA